MVKFRVSIRASARLNNEFIWVCTDSQRNISRYDPSLYEVLIKPDVDNVALGKVVRSALMICYTSPIKCSNKIDETESSNLYDKRVKTIMSIYRYRTMRAMFGGMKQCHMTLCGGAIEIMPLIHRGLDAWGRTKTDGIEDVMIPADSGDEEAGAALRLGFSRCREHRA